FADRVWPKVLESRVKNVKAELYEANKRIVHGDVYWELWGRINDNGTLSGARKLNKNNEKDGSNPSKAQLQKDLESYKQQMQTQLTVDYSDPKVIANKWRVLINEPIRVG